MILLRVPGTLEYRSLALRCVSEACKIAQADEWEAAALEAHAVSALGEAFNNVAIHAYAERAGDVTVEISWNREEMVIQLTDHGLSFDPEGVELPDLDSLPEGGMGLFIIRSFMDEVEYQAGPPNVLRMTKHRSSQTAGEMAPLSSPGGRPSSRTAPRRSSGPPRSSPAEVPLKPSSSRPKGTATSRSGWRMRAVQPDVRSCTMAEARVIGGTGRK